MVLCGQLLTLQCAITQNQIHAHGALLIRLPLIALAFRPRLMMRQDNALILLLGVMEGAT